MSVVVFTNIFCALMVSVLLIGINIQKERGDRSANSFGWLLIATFMYFLVNIISELFEGLADLYIYSYISNVFGYLLIDAIIVTFCAYAYSLFYSHNRKKAKLLNIVVVLSVARSVVIIFLTLSGKLFTIENGYFVEQQFASLPYYLSGSIMVVLVTIAIINRKAVSNRQFIVILLYEILPIPPIVIEMITGYYSLTSVALALSELLIYVLIQASRIENAKVRESILEELNNTDLLTGLNNRRSFYEKFGKINYDQNVGFMFLDINGLKYTNDHFGHNAGDILINHMAGILKQNFNQKQVFRISGDEFVVMILNISRADFNKTVSDFNNVILKNEKICSMGSAYGLGCCSEVLLYEAEKLMYESKKAYHKEKEVQESVN